jgi:phage shock protein C
MSSAPPDPPSGDPNNGQHPLPAPVPATPPGPPARPPLRRSSTDKLAGGVCGGLAEHTGIDSLVWRVGFVAITLAGGAGVVVYLLLWVLMPPGPRAPDQQPNPIDRLAEQVHDKVYSTGWLPPRN